MTLRKTEYPAIGETLYTTKLANGLPVYVLPKPGYRKTFAAIAANYGGADRRLVLDGRETLLPAGVAHYLEHKMFETRSGDALLTMSAAGADPNAFTDQSMTVYHFECTRRFEENLRTLLAFVSEPYFPRESVERLLPVTDIFFFDLKLMDPAAHQRVIGADNARILENARFLAAQGAELHFRLPLIPAVNDGEENLLATAAFIRSLGRADLGLELMPYHRMGTAKYAALDIPYVLEDLAIMPAARIEAVRETVEGSGVPCKVSQ